MAAVDALSRASCQNNQLLADSSSTQESQLRDSTETGEVSSLFDATLDFLADTTFRSVNDIYREVCGNYDLQAAADTISDSLPPLLTLSCNMGFAAYNVTDGLVPPLTAGFARTTYDMTWRRNPPVDMVLPADTSVTRNGEQMFRAATVGTLARNALSYEQFLTKSMASCGLLTWAMLGGGYSVDANRDVHMLWGRVGLDNYLQMRATGNMVTAVGSTFRSNYTYILCDTNAWAGDTTERFMVARLYMCLNGDTMPPAGDAANPTHLNICLVDVGAAIPFTEFTTGGTAYQVTQATTANQRAGMYTALAQTLPRHEIALAVALASSFSYTTSQAKIANANSWYAMLPKYSAVANAASWIMESKPSRATPVAVTARAWTCLYSTFEIFNRLLFQKRLFALGYPDLAVSLYSQSLVASPYLVDGAVSISALFTSSIMGFRFYDTNVAMLALARNYGRYWMPFEVSANCGVQLTFLGVDDMVTRNNPQRGLVRVLPRGRLGVPRSYRYADPGTLTALNTGFREFITVGSVGEDITCFTGWVPFVVIYSDGNSSGYVAAAAAFSTDYLITVAPKAQEARAVVAKPVATISF